MFKIRIDVNGFDKYTGLLGTVHFTDGVSDREVTQDEYHRLGAIMKMVRADTDEQVGATITMAQSRNVSAEVVAPSKTAEEETLEAVEAKYSRDALELIAEKDGLKGIRKIAEEFNVKGVQISKMIDDIVKAQEPKED